MNDVGTRVVPAAVLRPSTRSVDASVLLARSLTPEPMRPGRPEALKMAHSVLPYDRLLSIDERLEQAAAKPVIVPDTIVIDHGSVFVSAALRAACRHLGNAALVEAGPGPRRTARPASDLGAALVRRLVPDARAAVSPAAHPERQCLMSSAQLYDTIGATYTVTRRTEPRIAAQVWAALGDARTVLSVGAGTGSYEPPDRDVTAVEPSALMRSQRPAGAAPCLAGSAENLPFEDQSFDAAMALATIDHWQDPSAGLREMQRVARRVVVFTIDASDPNGGYRVSPAQNISPVRSKGSPGYRLGPEAAGG